MLGDARGQVVGLYRFPLAAVAHLDLQGGPEHRSRGLDVEAQLQFVEVVGVRASGGPDRSEQGGQGTDPDAIARSAVPRAHHTHVPLFFVAVVAVLFPASRPRERAVGATPADRRELVLDVPGGGGAGGHGHADQGQRDQSNGEPPHADIARITWATEVSVSSPASPSELDFSTARSGRVTVK